MSCSTAVALVIVAALLHALWNIVAKRTGGDRHFVLMGALLIVTLWAPLGLWTGCSELPRWGARMGGAAGQRHRAYRLLQRAARRLPSRRPDGGLSGRARHRPAGRSLAAVLVLGESLGRAAWPACWRSRGVFLIAGGPGLWRRRTTRRARARARRAALGRRTGLLIAVYTVLDGYAVKALLISPILVDYVGNLVRLPFMLPEVLRDRAGFARDGAAVARGGAVAVISPLGYVLVLYAVQLAPLSHVAPAREVSMLFAALIGGRLLGEDDRGCACSARPASPAG